MLLPLNPVVSTESKLKGYTLSFRNETERTRVYDWDPSAAVTVVRAVLTEKKLHSIFCRPHNCSQRKTEHLLW